MWILLSIWRYLGSLLNLCVTVAVLPLHFSHEYSISSIYKSKKSCILLYSTIYLTGKQADKEFCFLELINTTLYNLFFRKLTLKKRSRESWIEWSERDFFLRGRSMDRSLNCSLLVTTSPQLQNNTTVLQYLYFLQFGWIYNNKIYFRGIWGI